MRSIKALQTSFIVTFYYYFIPTMDKEITEQFAKTLREELPGVVDAVVDAKVSDLSKKTFAEMEEIKAEIKKFNLQGKMTDDAKELASKTALVAIFKDVLDKGVTSEAQFKEIASAHAKTMSEGTATDGAELVFDQFEQSILQVLKSFEVASLVKIISIAKGDKLSLPKVTNGITTAFVAEKANATDSEPNTSFVTIDIYKAMTLTNFTRELLEDTMTIPDLYDMLVNNIGESQGAWLEKQILAGTGSSAPEGILVNADVLSVQLATATHRASNISDSNIVDVFTKADRKFKRNSAGLRWITSQYVLGKLQALKTTDGYPLYPELRGANPTLMGVKVALTDDDSIAQNLAGDVAAKPTMIFGDLNHYLVVRRKGMTMERGYYGNNWTADIESVKSVSRFGGKCTFGEAFVKLINAAT